MDLETVDDNGFRSNW